MFQLVKIIDSSAPQQGDIRCFKKMGVKQYNFVKKYRFLYIFIIYNNNFRLYFHFFIYFTLFLSNFLYFLKKLDYIFLLILSSSYIIYYNYICINFVVFIIKYIIL